MAKFNPLYITTEGSGEYHANRYRIYFRQTGAGMSVAELNDELIRNFPSIFNGDVSGGTTNVASVVRRGDLSWRGEAPLQFTLDAELLETIDVPDVRDDWVGIVWKRAGRGFAAQTLQLRQSAAREAVVVSAGSILGAMLFGVVGGITGGWLADEVDEELMLSHFLAGRRSWVIRDAFDDDGARYLREPPTERGQVFFLETGAVERFSSWFYDVWPTATLADMMAPGGSIRAAIDLVWKNLLQNYLDYKGSAISAVPTSAIDLSVPSPDWETLGSEGVIFMWESFSGYRQVHNRGWTREMIALHPALEMQLPRILPGDLDAAVSWSRSRAYFFKGSLYWRYDLDDDQMEWNYPKRISRGWPGLPDDIDAAINGQNGKIYLFKGEQYWRWDKDDDALDDGYPKSIAEQWPGLPNGIDAAFQWQLLSPVYVFKGSQYWAWDLSTDSLESGPHDLSQLTGVPSGFDAALSSSSGSAFSTDRAYFFAGSRYYRWTDDPFGSGPGLAHGSLDEDYPKDISDHW